MRATSYASREELDHAPESPDADRRRSLRLVSSDLEEGFTWSEPVSRRPISDPALYGEATPAPPREVEPAPDPARAPSAEPTVASPHPERRTVVIRGRGAERYPTPRRGYESRLRPHERSGFKPDRVALWAVVLGVALLLAAVTSAHATALGPQVLAHLAAH